METDTGKMLSEGLAFIAKTNRLISHELKNILAIISETMGLIDELVELADNGKKLKPGKLRSLSGSIIEEVERANRIIRSMNTFAHSVDRIIKEVDVGQTVNLMIDVSRLDSASRRTKLRRTDGESCMISTVPLFLERLLSRAIDFSLRSAGPEKEIRVSCRPDADGVRIVFSGLASGISGGFPAQEENFLAGVSSAKILLDGSAGELHVILPKEIADPSVGNLLSEG
jgi:signal transduction histidine kinase